VDPAERRLEVVEELTWPDFVSRYRTVAAGDGGFEMDLATGREVPPAVPPAEILARTVRRLPPLLLADLLATTPGSLRLAGVVRDGEAWLTVVAAVHDGERLDLYLSEEGSLAAVGRLVEEPMLGDAYERVRFTGEIVAGGWRLPARIVRELQGIGATAELAVESAAWAPGDEAAFRPPAGREAAAPGAAPDAGGGATGGADWQALGPHLWRVPLAGSPDYAALVVERHDHLVLVEAPVGEAAVEGLLALLGERFPGKPLRWVVATHHHFDHSGGVPAALAAGATLVTTPGNEGFFRRAVGGPRTLSGREEPPAQIPIATVADRLVLPGGPPEVVALRVPANPHAEEMLAVWLPDSRVLFQGDLARFPLDAEGGPRPQAAALLALIDAAGLDVGRIVGVHGDAGTVAELQEAMAGTPE
jgi:glyoxylase-like metal-dependent hydrolase (beta-lactamase superfamily II)